MERFTGCDDCVHKVVCNLRKSLQYKDTLDAHKIKYCSHFCSKIIRSSYGIDDIVYIFDSFSVKALKISSLCYQDYDVNLIRSLGFDNHYNIDVLDINRVIFCIDKSKNLITYWSGVTLDKNKVDSIRNYLNSLISKKYNREVEFHIFFDLGFNIKLKYNEGE